MQDIYGELFQQDDEYRARVNALQTREPQRVANARRVARAVNAPPALVEGEPDIYQREFQRRQVEETIREHPWMAQWLGNPDNAALARDDTPQLGRVAGVLRPITGDEARALSEAYGRAAAGRGARPANNLGETAVRQTLLGSGSTLPRIAWNYGPPAEQPLEDIAARARALPREAPIRANPFTVGRQLYAGTLGLGTQAVGGAGLFVLDALGVGEDAWLRGEFETTVREGQDIAQRYRITTDNWAANTALGAGQMLFDMAAGSGLVRSGRAMAGLFGGTVGLEGYGRFRERGATANEALVGGTISGGAEYIFERSPMGFLFGRFGSEGVGSFLGGYLRREVPSEVATTIVQSAADAAIANPDMTMGQFLRQLPQEIIDTAAITTLAGGAIGGAHRLQQIIRPVQRDMVDVEMALGGQQFLDRLMEEAAQSQVRELDPDTFSQFVHSRTDGTPVQNLYIPVEAVDTYLQSEGAETDFFELYAEQIAEARRLGGDVVVPIGEAAAQLAGTPVWQAIREDVRVTPGGMSGREAREKARTFMQELETRGEEIAREAQTEGEALAPVVAIYQRVKNELLALGRGEREAEAIAQLFAARREAGARRLGMEVAAYDEARPVSFRVAEPGEKPGANALLARDEPPEAVVNIGLNIGEEVGALSVEEAKAAFEELGVVIRSSQVRESDTEPTLIARLSRPLTEEEGMRLAERLRQQSVAQFAEGVGDLLGPMAEEWRPFNPAFFLTETGRLSEELESRRPAMANLPKTSPGVFMPARAAAQRYADRYGFVFAAPQEYLKVDPERAARIAQAFEEMEHAPNDPEVRAAYDALVSETLAQWEIIKDTGLAVEFVEGADPYGGNPWGAVRDVRDNNHLWVFNTEDGYGQEGITPQEEAVNPMLAIVEGETISGRPVRVNDIFRIVHDYFGHIKEGVGFRASGEENAWRIHSAMFSPLARRALTTETRGQNSWLNYGPHGEANRSATVEATVFAEQKIGLLPAWVAEEGLVADVRADVLPSASWSEERIGGLIDEYGYSDGSSKAYAARMSPDEFLGLTASPELQARIAERTAELGEFSEEQLGRSRPIFLDVEFGQHRNMVMGHEGRHRMTMLKAQGIQSVPVVVRVRNGKATEDRGLTELMPQRDRDSQGEQPATVAEMIPISWQNRDRLLEMAGAGRVLFQTGDGALFYSALERAVEAIGTTRAPAAQWIATLRKTPGVKQEELEWSGLLEFLEMQDGPIEKARLLELLRGGGIVVDEVVLGATSDFINQRSAYLYTQVEDAIVDSETRAALVARLENSARIHVIMRRNHPELLDEEGDLVEGWADIVVADVLTVEQDAYKTAFETWTSDPNNETYRELLITLPIGRGKNPARAPSTHWDVESVVAHARFMEKRDAEGRRVLFIEEVQSDWHQKGRDEGYERELSVEEMRARDAALQAAIGALTEAEAAHVAKGKEVLSAYLDSPAAAERRDDFNLAVGDWLANPDPARLGSLLNGIGQPTDELRTFREAELRVMEAQQAASRGREGVIPNAPFKASWPALVMKRMIRWAVDNGYERVAWTTGEEQAERYNLGARTGTIGAAWDGGDKYRLSVERYEAQQIIQRNFSNDGSEEYTKEQLTEIFGRDVADRLTAKAREQQVGFVTLSGEDLRVGGEGMKAFYDRNLVNITNDLIKKYGAKVEQINVTVAGQNQQYIEPALVNARRQLERTDLDEVARRHWQNVVASYERDISQLTSPHPGFEITPQLAAAAQQGFALFQEQKTTGTVRGQAQFFPDGQAVVTLFETANLSTLIHELGHVFLEELAADAALPNAPAELKADFAKVRAWFAANGAPVRRGDIPTKAHELFARGFERYAMEGKAPSSALRRAFAQFRAWLLRIYEVVQNLNAPITPEIREVFDRMLATQDAIDSNRGTEAHFTDAEQAGMTEAEWAAYEKSLSDARDEAYDALLFKTMAAIRRREEQRIRDQRANVRAEVAADINSRPEFVALHLLRTGRWLGEPDREPQRVKLNTGWLIDNYGEDVLGKLPRGLPITRGDGVDGDTIAEMTGLASGDLLVKTLIAMREASDRLRARGEKRSVRDMAIESEVDRIMAARHGDTMTDGSIEEEAVDAINNARQGEITAGELRQLTKRRATLGGPTPYQVAREWARRKIMSERIVDVASRAAIQRYTRATEKAAREFEAAILADDVDAAFRHKQAQLLNHALLVEAKKAADQTDQIVARMQRYAKRKAMKSVDQDYFDRVHELLERFDFRARSQKAIDEKNQFEDWAERRRAEGFEVPVPPRLDFSEHYSRISLATLLELNDAVTGLVELGKLKQKLIDGQGERDFAEARDEIVANVEQLPDRKLPSTPVETERRLGAAAAAALLKVETIADELDLQDSNGPMNRLLVQGASRAANERDALSDEVLVPLVRLFMSQPRAWRKRMHDKVTSDVLNWNTLREGDPRVGSPVTMTRMEWLAVALNTGNLSNLEKMSKGERWPAQAIQAEVNRILEKEDWDFVQATWDATGKLWPHIARVERQMSGVVPEQVEALEIETRFGTYRGGYWPVVYDVNRSQRAENNADDETNDLFGFKSGIGTPKGHTITRTEAVGPLSYRLEEVLMNHMEKVVTRIAYAPWVRDVVRMIDNSKVRGIIDTKLGPEYRRQIKPWLRRQINSTMIDKRGAAWWDGILRNFRTNMSIAVMGFAYSTGIAQTLGLGFSAGRIGPVYVARGMKRMLHKDGGQSAQDFVFSRSAEMERRGREMNREVVEVFQKLRGGRAGWYTNAQAMAFWHIAMIDRYMVAMPTWLGAHQKGVDEGMTDEEASAYADKIVRNSQGSGREKDLAAVQSPNSDAMRFFTMFYTPFNVMFNAQWDSVRAAKSGDWRRSVMLTSWFLLTTALADALMAGDWPGDDDDEELTFEALASWFGRNVFFSLWAGIPVARDVANYAERKIIGEYSNLATPVESAASAVERAAVGSYGVAFENEEVTGRYVKQMATAAGYMFGLPGGQVGKTGGFLWAVYRDEANPETIRDWHRGLTSGRSEAQE